MEHADLILEIKRLEKLLRVAQKHAIKQYKLIDKLTALGLRTQALLFKLERIKG